MEEKQSIIACGVGSVSKRVYPDGRIERCENVKDEALKVRVNQKNIWTINDSELHLIPGTETDGLPVKSTICSSRRPRFNQL